MISKTIIIPTLGALQLVLMLAVQRKFYDLTKPQILFSGNKLQQK